LFKPIKGFVKVTNIMRGRRILKTRKLLVVNHLIDQEYCVKWCSLHPIDALANRGMWRG
jgi:hypothetical protein